MFPSAAAWCHKMANVRDKLLKSKQPEAKILLRDIYHALRTNATRRMRSARTALYLVYRLIRHAETHAT